MPRILGEGNTKEEAISDFKTKLALIQGKGKADIKFSIYKNTINKKYFIAKKVGSNIIQLKEFDKVEQAYDFRKNNHKELLELLEKSKYIPALRRATNRERIGKTLS